MKFRLTLALALIIIIPLGLATKWYTGPAAPWVHHYAGAVLYEIFWILLIQFLIPESEVGPIALGVFIVTALLEVLHLFNLPILDELQRSFLGRTLFGTSFDPWDFFYYFIGCGIGYVKLRAIKKMSG